MTTALDQAAFGARYVDPAFAELERERMWRRVWLLGAFARDLAGAGDFVATEVGHESVLIVRDGEGFVRAFHNVCLHRGNRLAQRDRGRVKRFRCGYHGWEYGLDGQLLHVFDEASFDQPLTCGRLALEPLPCVERGGFVWFSLDPEAEPLDDFLGPLVDEWLPYRFDEQNLLDDRTIEIECNWKIGVEAFSESYHLNATHPQLQAFVDDSAVALETIGRHGRAQVPFGRPSGYSEDRETLNQDLRNMLLRFGLDEADVDGSPDRVRGALQQAKRALAEEAGIDLSGLSDAQLTDDFQYSVFPNVAMNVHAEGFVLHRFRPHPSDPERSFWDLAIFERIAPGAARPLRPVHRRHRHGEESLGQALDQDAYNLPNVQRGMRSRAFERPLLSRFEQGIAHFHRELDDYLERGD
jgi:phenylpropionate dioxygenase-like ring-hydroxylating dioxygenase large terminal subunit